MRALDEDARKLVSMPAAVKSQSVQRFVPLYAGDDYCGGLVGPVVVLIGKDRPGPLLPEHGREWSRQANAEYPEGCGFMIVLRSEAPPPNDETRGRVSKFLEECSRTCIAGAIVIEGEGFVAASIRAFFGAFALINYRFRLKVHGSTREASGPMMKRLGRLDPQEAADLTLGIEELKAAFAAGTLVVSPSRSLRA
jgi:hypothetical protein